MRRNSGIENPRRPPSVLRLARHFGTTSPFWLNLPGQDDLDAEVDRLGDRLDRELTAHASSTPRAACPGSGAHGLRHTYTTAALRTEVSPVVVSKRLGHGSVVVTLSIYAHVFEQDDQAAAEMTARAIFVR